MIEAPGIVERVQDGAVWVRLTEQQTGCGRCHEPGGCGGARIAHALGKPNDVFKIEMASELSVGEAVRLVADERAALKAGLLAYGLPTVGAIVGAAVGTSVGGQPGAPWGLVVGLVVAIALVRRASSARKWSDGVRVSVLPSVSSCQHAH